MKKEYDSFDEDDDTPGILKKALHVEMPPDFNPNKAPQTGEEYLQHVIYERTKCKTWVTANIDRTKLNQQTFKDPTIKQPSNFVPAQEWQKRKIEDFTNFRKFIQFKITKESTLSYFNEETFMAKAQSEYPQFSKMINFTQAAKMRMLSRISKHISSLKPGDSINEELGAWIYAILALLEKPLSPDSCFSLREFAKKCLVLRSNLCVDADESCYAPLNLFICIVSRFYNQLDLAD